MRLCVYVVFKVYVHSAISLVQLVNPESQIHAHKHYMSEARPSFRGWRGWQARLKGYVPEVAIFEHLRVSRATVSLLSGRFS